MFSFLGDDFADWRYENAMGASNPNEDGPKLEDFLGCCYSNSPPDHRHQNNVVSDINVNIAPSFNANGEIDAGENDLTNSSHLLQPYDHYNETPQTLIPSNGMYKSWLGQTLYSEGNGNGNGNGCSFQSLSLTMSPSSSAQNGLDAISPAQLTDTRKRPAVSKTLAREPVPRKSIDTFGQRTSQFRGVTRY